MKWQGKCGLLLLFLGFGAWGLDGEAPSITHIDTEQSYSLPMEPLASQVSGTTVYSQNASFVSETYEVGDFQLLALQWMQDLPDPSQLTVEVEVFKDGQSLGWMPLEVDHDGEVSEDQSYSVLLIDGDAFRYRVFLLTNDPSLTPKLSEIQIDAINGGELAPVEQFTQDFSRLVFDEEYEIVSRDEWGADMDLMVYEPDSDEDLPDEDAELPKGAYEMEYYDEDGRPLIWPIEYVPVEAIVLHHTVSGSDSDDYEATVRAIFLYHTITRGWGDIGYNYLVDPNGVIYEGRYGGDDAVAGHTYGYNEGTVGVALIGNYETQSVSEEAMNSVSRLVYELSKKYDLDPMGNYIANGDSFPVVAGHRDYDVTSCPGDFFYKYIDEIKNMVAEAIAHESDRGSDSSGDYAFEETLDSKTRPLIAVEVGQAETVTIYLKNIGENSWNSNTYLKLGNSDWEGHLSLDLDGSNIANLKGSSVAPGSMGAFQFPVEALPVGSLSYLPLTLVYDGTMESEAVIDVGIYVPQTELLYEISDVNLDQSELKKGDSTTVNVTLKNTSSFAWEKDGDYPLVLNQSGTSALNYNTTLAEMEESEVTPGEEAHFTFELTVPNSVAAGEYSLYFQPSLENSDALVSSVGQVTIEVSASAEDLVSSLPSDLTLKAGEEETLWIELENITDSDWTQKGWGAFDFATVEPIYFEVSTPQFQVTKVSSGSKAKIYFNVTVDENTPEGDYSIIFWPRSDRAALTQDPYILHVTVAEPAVVDPSASSDPLIRILLTPEGDFESHLLSVNEDAKVYAGDEFLGSLDAGELIRITLDSGQYEISSEDIEETVSGPVRIIPNEEDALVTVHTITDAASWDTSLVYNEFRGSMELQEYKDELVLINELPIEDYILGLAEVGSTTNPEKMKVMSIISRTYGLWYVVNDYKFPEIQAQLSDSPEDSQKYLGYAFEQSMPVWANAVEATEGLVVTYDGELVKTPYFSATDGTVTYSAEEKWGWTDTPYLVSVSDSYCATSTAFSGHGVGLSGCGAEGMADAGFSFEEIITHYYTGVEIQPFQE